MAAHVRWYVSWCQRFAQLFVPFHKHKCCLIGGALVKFPVDMPKSEILTERDLDYYAWQFQQSGFFGNLSWYRNVDANMKWSRRAHGRKIHLPCLMVTAENDIFFPPTMTDTMSTWIPNLTLHGVRNVGHWVLQEAPDECSRVLLEWLESTTLISPSRARSKL
mmetsp:Transcript_20756/g.31696  ORF Transcript_20756/g.31696 Transcript_20756/m.31696 type:complete len:163 (+) Transcript_20756:704-1192(+)